MDIKGIKALARNYHAGQKDKLGRDYVDHHLQSVADKLAERGEHAVMAGWLHDVLEDTEMTSAELERRGVPSEVIRAVESVTRRNDESYDDLVTRAAADPLGKLVKLADNEVNQESNPALAQTDTGRAARLMKKYERAHRQLEHHPSHLFVVHGKIGEVVHDAVIIPTDSSVEVEPHWYKIVGQTSLPEDLDFSDGSAQWGSSSAWLVDVASGDFNEVLDRLRTALDNIDAVRTWGADGPRGGRPLPLVVLPVLGIGLGGRGDDKGAVLRQLITTLQAAVSALPFDIALVTPDPAVYAAAQYIRRMSPSTVAVDEDAHVLAEKAKSGELALFLGAGVSIAAGLPTWTGLIEELAKDLPAEDQEALKGLDITDRAQLIEQLAPDGFQHRVAEITAQATTPSLVHALLAGLDVSQVVTTNYDTLYEAAARAADHTVDVVLPHQSAVGQNRWILKMHGDVDHDDKIVLTRRHMVMYDAANRPSAALLQSLLLTKHLVIIGASMTDPNVVRLTHEVDEYRKAHGQSPREAYGTVVDAGPSSPSQGKLWKDQLDWVDLPSKEIGSGPRALEVLLDRVGMFASSKSPWLLDARFSGMLDPGDQAFADSVRSLAADASLKNDTWQPLRDALISLGIDDKRR